MKGVGVHVFAGGFTRGVRETMPVVGQLEIHDFGRETVEAMGLPFMNAGTWQGWRDYRSTWEDCSFCYGNPRCIAFSNSSAGHSSAVRGPTARPCQDIRDLCNFGVEAGLDVVSFESVQQAYTVGKPLLDELVGTKFAPNGYRVCHLFVNTAAEGNAQCRRRYFFVAYKRNRNFNVHLPVLPKHRTVVRDVLRRPDVARIKPHPGRITGKSNVDYDAGTYPEFKDDAREILPYLEEGQSLKSFAKHDLETLRVVSEKYYDKWVNRKSNLPFSLHCPRRLKSNKHCPTIASTARNYVHPWEDRTLTVGEIAALMGWPKYIIPSGPNPIAQVGKGVVPATGKWLAEQIKYYLEDGWGREDFESKYDHHVDVFRGHDHTGSDSPPLEKVFNLTWYLPPFREGDGT